VSDGSAAGPFFWLDDHWMCAVGLRKPLSRSRMVGSGERGEMGKRLSRRFLLSRRCIDLGSKHAEFINVVSRARTPPRFLIGRRAPTPFRRTKELRVVVCRFTRVIQKVLDSGGQRYVLK